MTKRHGLLLIILLLTIAAFMGPRTQSASNLPPLTNLAPGTDLRIQQNVDVNIVLVGFNGLLTPADILAQGIGVRPADWRVPSQVEYRPISGFHV
jgi:hypothetical protein